MKKTTTVMLTDAQVKTFRQNGFLAVDGFFDARETAALQADVKRLRENGFLRNVHTLGDGATHDESAQNLQMCPAGYCSALIRSLPFCPRVVATVSALIGPEIAHHLDQIFLKPANVGKGTGWHQDNAYFKIRDPLKGTAMWIAIDDATAANGTMRVVPRKFKDTLTHDRDPNSDHHISCRVDEDEAVTVELAAGGALFFCYGTPHTTGDNTTARDRAGLAYHFINVAFAPDGFFTSQRRRNHAHPYLNGPLASNGVAEYGEPMRETWNQAVRRMGGPD